MSRFLLCAATLAVTLPGQSAPCESLNDANTVVSTGLTFSPFVGSNPNSTAYQFSPANTIAVQSAAIFTASPLHDDYMRIEIWSDDTVNNEPMARMAVGTFFSAMSANARWLGANLDTTVVLNPGTNYWINWIESGASIPPEEPGGVALSRRQRSASNPWGTLGSGELKFRLFCGPLDAQGVANEGSGCAASNLQIATTHTNDAAMSLNGGFGVEGNNLPAGASVVLLVGIDSNFSSTPLTSFPAGCQLNTDIAAFVAGTAGTAEIGDQPTTPRPVPFGFLRFSLPLTTVQQGAYFSVQCFGLDMGAAAVVPFVSTNGVRVTTF